MPEASRRYGYVPVPLSARDSANAINVPTRYLTQRYPDQSPDVIRKAVLDMSPSSEYPPLARVLVGRDGTIWLAATTRGAIPATENKWTVLAPNGDPLGVVSLPGNVIIQDANRSTIWAIESASAASAPDATSGMRARAQHAGVVRYDVIIGSGVP